MQKNKLQNAPPFVVETAIKHVGANIKIARLRRNLTIQDLADKIGTGPRAISNAEKGNLTTGIWIYAAILWALDLLEQLESLANPSMDPEGQQLARLKEPKRARQRKDIDNDF